MPDRVDEIAAELVNLPASCRARLIRKLIDSLEQDQDEKVEDLWTEEIERRAREVDEGKVQMLDWDDVLNEIRAIVGE